MNLKLRSGVAHCCERRHDLLAGLTVDLIKYVL
jgi:hypothetical protein